MAWNDVKAAGDLITSSNHNAIITVIESKPTMTRAAGAPSSAPTELLSLYIDSTNNKCYFAVGTSSVDDWRKVAST